MARAVLHTLVVAALAWLLCLSLVASVSAQPVVHSIYDSIDCKSLDPNIQISCQEPSPRTPPNLARSINRLRARAPDRQSTSVSSTSTSPVPSGTGTPTPPGVSNQALTGALVVLGIIFAGFILYFAWQCIGFARGGRSGKPMFGYIGV
ncbi:hypothetical protein FS749_013687 [Ceratobasidium sp. UAMH 11750]|nr:hypothetical protein FS749_013687 [Ceratobasidium sp. UAMH 11750]